MKYADLSTKFVELLKIGINYMTTENNPNTKISDIVTFISDNALTRITIDDICKHTHISKYHLCRIFKEHIGVTIGDFIKSKRLSVAKQLLADTELTITQIAHHCCFTDASFFSKTFQKEFGIRPTAFRTKYR
jgi:AraC-like DNA-binding protein